MILGVVGVLAIVLSLALELAWNLVVRITDTLLHFPL
jgi:hypothetical protein